MNSWHLPVALVTDQAIHSCSSLVAIAKAAFQTTITATACHTFPFDYSCYIRVVALDCFRRSPSVVATVVSTS